MRKIMMLLALVGLVCGAVMAAEGDAPKKKAAPGLAVRQKGTGKERKEFFAIQARGVEAIKAAETDEAKQAASEKLVNEQIALLEKIVAREAEGGNDVTALKTDLENFKKLKKNFVKYFIIQAAK